MCPCSWIVSSVPSSQGRAVKESYFGPYSTWGLDLDLFSHVVIFLKGPNGCFPVCLGRYVCV